MAFHRNEDDEFTDLITPPERVLQLTNGDAERVRQLINIRNHSSIRRNLMSFIESFPNDRQNQLYLIYLFVFMRSLEFTVYQAEIFNLFRRVDRAIYDISEIFDSIYEVDDISNANRNFVVILLENIRIFSGMRTTNQNILDYRSEPRNLVVLIRVLKFYALSMRKTHSDRNVVGDILFHWIRKYSEVINSKLRPDPAAIFPVYWRCLKRCYNSAQIEIFAARFLDMILGYAKDKVLERASHQTANTMTMGLRLAEVYSLNFISFITSDSCADIILLPKLPNPLKPAIDLFIQRVQEQLPDLVDAAGLLGNLTIKILTEFETRGEFENRGPFRELVFSLV